MSNKTIYGYKLVNDEWVPCREINSFENAEVLDVFLFPFHKWDDYEIDDGGVCVQEKFARRLLSILNFRFNKEFDAFNDCVGGNSWRHELAIVVDVRDEDILAFCNNSDCIGEFRSFKYLAIKKRSYKLKPRDEKVNVINNIKREYKTKIPIEETISDIYKRQTKEKAEQLKPYETHQECLCFEVGFSKSFDLPNEDEADWRTVNIYNGNFGDLLKVIATEDYASIYASEDDHDNGNGESSGKRKIMMSFTMGSAPSNGPNGPLRHAVGNSYEEAREKLDQNYKKEDKLREIAAEEANAILEEIRKEAKISLENQGVDRLELEDIMRLLDLKAIDGMAEYLLGFMQASGELFDQHGGEWIVLNRERLFWEWRDKIRFELKQHSEA